MHNGLRKVHWFLFLYSFVDFNVSQIELKNNNYLTILTSSVAVISETVELNMARISPKNCSGNRLFLVQKNLSVFSRCCDMLLNCQYNKQTILIVSIHTSLKLLRIIQRQINSQVENGLVSKISQPYITRVISETRSVSSVFSYISDKSNSLPDRKFRNYV